MVKLIAFDLDGTLTQHKMPLEEKNRDVLNRLAQKYSLVMLGAGQCMRIYQQMNEYPIDIIGNYGLQYAEYDARAQKPILKRDLVFPCDRDSVAKRIDTLREKYGFTEFFGKGVEFHPSGCVTFPILGTEVGLEDRLAFDPDRSRRRKIYDEVCEVFGEYTVFVGGSTSFDMVPAPYDKYYALDLYCKEKGFSHGETLFAGDDYGRGGNDESVYRSDFGFIGVDDYRKLDEILADLL